MRKQPVGPIGFGWGALMYLGPLAGLLFHWLGGAASASFYVPYKSIRHWSWEVFWITGGLFSWLLCPWLFAFIQSKDLLNVLGSVPVRTLFWCWFWGCMWGLGGLTFGLTMRYLGLSLGMAVALGLTTVIGTLGPPVFRGTLWELASTGSGRVTFIGIAVTLIGIVAVALAGRAKERENVARTAAGSTATGSSAMPAKAAVTDSSAMSGKSAVSGSSVMPEFALRKGLLIAVFSGVMSGCFAWGLDAGQPIREASRAAGTSELWQGLAVLCVVLAGGLTTNLIWCLTLIIRKRSAGEFVGRPSGAPLLRNYLFAAAGGTLWYLQFFFYTMGESQMGRYAFSSWTLHMASIILFSTLWGFALGEWQGVSRRTRNLVWIGISILVGSTVIIGFGNYLSAST